ncbi:MAG: hypothetical protein ACK5H2_04555 [Beutenbergiaceae bacterium]
MASQNYVDTKSLRTSADHLDDAATHIGNNVPVLSGIAEAIPGGTSGASAESLNGTWKSAYEGLQSRTDGLAANYRAAADDWDRADAESSSSFLNLYQ